MQKLTLLPDTPLSPQSAGDGRVVRELELPSQPDHLHVIHSVDAPLSIYPGFNFSAYFRFFFFFLKKCQLLYEQLERENLLLGDNYDLILGLGPTCICNKSYKKPVIVIALDLETIKT